MIDRWAMHRPAFLVMAAVLRAGGRVTEVERCDTSKKK
jgi:hypothetical protein